MNWLAQYWPLVAIVGIVLAITHFIFYTIGVCVGMAEAKAVRGIECEHAFLEGRRSERVAAGAEAAEQAGRFVLLTTGDGSEERPFTRRMHVAQCAAFRGRDCDCDLTIAQGGPRA